MFRSSLAYAFFLCTLAGSANAVQEWRSPARQSTLLELYTSEGCSSCPPADRWLSGLLESPQLWQSVFPLAFHVDYWNYLGWTDRFANPDNSRRQRRYHLDGLTRGVYTPGIVAGGLEWRGWRQGQPVPHLQRDMGILWLKVDSGQFEARFDPEPEIAEQVSRADLNLALVGVGLSTRVRAGENRGSELNHDFVVLAHSVFSGKGLSWSGSVPPPLLEENPSRWALVAWVSPPGELPPLQVVGGWWTRE